MGQQNLLLIVVGIMIVAVATVVAISMFRGNSVETARNNLIVDLGFYAQKAMGETCFGNQTREKHII